MNTLKCGAALTCGGLVVARPTKGPWFNLKEWKALTDRFPDGAEMKAFVRMPGWADRAHGLPLRAALGIVLGAKWSDQGVLGTR